MSNKTQNSNYFSLLQKSGSYKNMLNFMAIVYVSFVPCCDIDDVSLQESFDVLTNDKITIIRLMTFIFHSYKYSLVTLKSNMFILHMCIRFDATLLDDGISYCHRTKATICYGNKRRHPSKRAIPSVIIN